VTCRLGNASGHVTRINRSLKIYVHLLSSFLVLYYVVVCRASSSSQNTTEFLQNANFLRSDSSQVPPDHAVTASDLIMAAYDPAKLHPLAELGDKLDYLLLDDDKTNELPGAGTAIPSRGWSDDLCYGTGTMYLSGAYRSLSNYCFRKPCSLKASFIPQATLTLSQHLKRPIFRPLIVLFCHMFNLFFVQA
jgi:hypothetical protein